AVLAFAREGYKLRTVRISELFDVLQFRGFRKLSRKHWKTGLLEMWRSFSDGAFLRAIQRLVPDIQRDDLLSSPAGVRAQAVFPDGTLADDFVIETTRNTVHVINAPSPAATASLAIGKHIGSLVRERMA
ncbi:MAG: FAD-dependent oxidoreductase, partial [Rubricoccaceae bacterium]|nr:FAD-dependent oxidoreductase [Rubricoccaceae bacterium]